MTTYSSVPVESAVNSTAVAIAAGAYHTCVVLGGNVQCWGDNSHGQTDGGSEILFNTAIAVTAGAYHTCALLSGGNVECWGDNTYGQLGASTTTSSVAQPIPVTGITGATAVSAGGAHTCALFSGGTIQCWGDNSYGQLGISVSVQGSSKPVTVSGIGLTGISTTDATMVSAGEYHTCAVLMGGTVQCWGRNGSGQLGNGTTADSSVPVAVSGVTNATAVAAGNDNTCALLSNGSIQCWGNTYGGAYGISNGIVVAVGGGQTCALLSGGKVQCWGFNSYGQLGNGTTTNSSTPVTVSGF